MTESVESLPDLFSKIELHNQHNAHASLIIGHPYRPTRSSIVFLKEGRVVLKEDIEEKVLTNNCIYLLDSRYVYEILELSEHLVIQILGYSHKLVESPYFKLNQRKIYRTIHNRQLSLFKVTDIELDLMYENLRMLGYYLKNQDKFDYSLNIIENYFNILLYQVIAVASPQLKELSKQMGSKEPLVYEFFVLLSQHYLEGKPVQFYADQLSITIRHLSSVVKQVTDKTPNQIIGLFLLNEAKMQLASSNMSISQIAMYLKFSDQYAFTHFFKRHTGISPTQYREKVIQ